MLATNDKISYAHCCRSEVAIGVISGVAVEDVTVDVIVKFGDSRSNRSWDTRPAQFVMDDQRRTQRTAPVVLGRKQKCHLAFRRVLVKTVSDVDQLPQ